MTEPSQGRSKDHRLRQLQLVPAGIAEAFHEHDPLRWWTSHPERPGEINLHEFADGLMGAQLRKRRQIDIGFTARPALIAELAPYIKICSVNAPSTTVQNINPSLRTWWRILDECDHVAPVQSLRDLNEIHNAAFLRLGSRGHKHYSIVMSFIRVARDDLRLPPLYWSTPPRPNAIKGLVDQRTVSLLYHHLKRQCFEMLQRYSDEPTSAPVKADATHTLMLFLLRTGWNLQAALDIDVRADSNGRMLCISPHPTSSNHHIVTSRKARAKGREQFALGANKSQLSCGNLLNALVKQSSELRARLSFDLEELTLQLAATLPGEREDLLAKIKSVKAMIKSPWIYNKNSQSSATSSIRQLTTLFASNGGTAYMTTLTNAVNASLAICEKKINRITISDLRDAYIEAQYARSGYSWLTAMLAAQHGSVESVAAYLRKRQYKAHSEKRFVTVTEKMWEGVIERNAVDPARIAGQIAGATTAQLTRWQEGKDRTRVGMGCRDFLNPPRDIAPSHVGGTGCRIQRCTLCSHGIIFTDSVEHIARRVEELLHIQESVSVISWTQSTFPAELETAREILRDVFVAEDVDRWRSYWADQIATGLLLPLAIEGAYE